MTILAPFNEFRVGLEKEKSGKVEKVERGSLSAEANSSGLNFIHVLMKYLSTENQSRWFP
jgi:hypothetical protein